MLGTFGRLLLLIAFVACLISGYGFFKAAKNQILEARWKPLARGAWLVMFSAVVGASLLLFYLILTNQFQYYYPYNYSSYDLPSHYLFSAFWAGQEGSFLLWIIYTGILGIFLTRWARAYEAPVMTVVACCQIFLISMVVGVKFGPLVIGSSPFMTLAEKFPTAPMLQIPGFIPADGNGLNDLLQNYWMMIHPPTLFVGFTAMIVPFAYAVAGLWKRQYTEWVKPALPWALFANLILMIGITMGGYWAYVTLSFGGYWAWDPVENSSFVPWLIGVAAIHTMIAQKRSGSSQKAAIFLSILAFMLVIYSTFLTRSGILGDISVHSFVDLGLYNQLLIWILAMAVIGFGLFFYRYKELPVPAREPRMMSREFMIFSGAMILCALGAVIILGTSAPIIGKLFRDSPSAVPLAFYDRWSLPLAMGLAFLAGLGQLFWWNKMDAARLNRVVTGPLALSFVCTIAVLLFTPFLEQAITLPASEASTAMIPAGVGSFWGLYGQGILLLMLIFCAFFAFFGNGAVLWKIGRGNPKMAGGAVAHIGLALMLLGILTSSGFNTPITDDFAKANDRDNFIIERDQTLQLDGFSITYTGQATNADGHNVYTLNIVDPQGRPFTATPVVYKTRKDQWVQNPDIQMYVEKDLYISVAPSIMYEDQGEETTDQPPGGEVRLKRGESARIGNDTFEITFTDFDLNIEAEKKPAGTEIAVGAQVQVTNRTTGQTRTLRPVYLVMADRTEQFIQNRISEWNMTVSFAKMHVDDDAITLVIEGVQVTPEDWLVVQLYEKPFISLLWLGAILMFGGFALAIARRVEEHRRSPRA